jgi:pimeloyl-[acyl-carrier protein] methyl ester esterase
MHPERSRTFLPGWGVTAEVWHPFARPGDRLGGEIEPGTHVVGWSLGAMRALDFATRNELGSLTLVAATDQFVRSHLHLQGWPARVLVRMRKRLFEESPQAVLEEFVSQLFVPGEPIVAPPLEDDLTELEEGLVFLEHYSVLGNTASIRCPVRLLHGGADSICPLQSAQALAHVLPQAELTVWPEAGHAPLLTQPDRVRAWLD